MASPKGGNGADAPDLDPELRASADNWHGGGPGAAPDEETAAELVDKELLQTCLNGPSSCEIFRWESGQGDQVMKPTATHVCFLSRLQGNMTVVSTVLVHDSPTDLVPSGRLSSERGTHWKLAGLGAGLLAHAICVPQSRFFTNAGGVRWLSERFAAMAVTGANGCTAQSSKDTWWGDATTFLSGVSGTFEGNGEIASISFGTGMTPSSVSARTNHCQSQIQATAYSYFVGIPGWNRTPRLVCNGECTGQNGEYRVSAANGAIDSVPMAESTHAVCYFTRISGEFNSSLDRVRIYPSPPDQYNNPERWILEARATAGASASARARCVAYNQQF